MKVLHLPFNISSQISITVRALRDIGIDARGIVFGDNPIQSNIGINIFKNKALKPHPVRARFRRFLRVYPILSAISWADIVHWHFKGGILPRNFDLKYISYLNKPSIVEFWGSDIRIPGIATANNPYYMKLASEPNCSINSSYQKSRKLQETFFNHGFECLLSGPELFPYVQNDLFPNPFRIEPRLILSEFKPNFVDSTAHKPIIVHMPSNKEIKGTSAVLRAVETLKTQYDFEFKLIHQMPHKQSMEIVRGCDIMLDQFVLGSFGFASMEAMALGKTVICYIEPDLRLKFPRDLPIINANQDNLVNVVEDLISNREKLYEIGIKSRMYCEKHFDAYKISEQLVSIYKEIIDKKTRRLL